ncbi:MAG: hypothetical protein LUI05_02160 [Oscillospiraceae bacterium]|nr:hypothetical protein [Oscillospiraceae bacterium]
MRTGDGVTIGYDFDGKWLVSSDVGEELGYLPSRLAENPAYEPYVYVNSELDSVRILGLAVAYMSLVK